MSFELPHIINDLCHDMGVANDQYHWREIIVVGGTGGSRVDAVTAWLNDQSALTGIAVPRWKIATATGKTLSANYNHWFFERFQHGRNYDEDLYWLQHTYHPNGKILIQRHHDIEYLHTLLWDSIKSCVRYLWIEPSNFPDLVVKQIWEFVVKSILQMPMSQEFSRDLVMTRVRRMFFNHLARTTICSVPAAVIGYDNVVSASGSRELATILNIEISDYQHAVWAKGVAAGNSPELVEFNSELWRRSEVEAVYYEVIKEYSSRQFLTTG